SMGAGASSGPAVASASIRAGDPTGDPTGGDDASDAASTPTAGAAMGSPDAASPPTAGAAMASPEPPARRRPDCYVVDGRTVKSPPAKAPSGCLRDTQSAKAGCRRVYICE
ncbi:MAG: hypothetical protein KDK70_25435, partial [Myxococcales bacterium]|nr:hypothetical protein [Myxococcales bacterium]